MKYARTPQGSQWVFIHPPKTAGTSIGDYMLTHWKDYGDIRHHAWDPRLVPKPDVVFAVIRNPYDRLVSFYQELRKILNYEKNSPTAKILRETLTLDDYKNNSFEWCIQRMIDTNFVYYQEQPPHEPVHVTWSQHQYLPQDGTECHLLRFDHIRSDFQRLLEYHGEQAWILEHRNPGYDPYLDYEAVHTPVTRHLVETLWQDDLELWKSLEREAFAVKYA